MVPMMAYLTAGFSCRSWNDSTAPRKFDAMKAMAVPPNSAPRLTQAMSSMRRMRSSTPMNVAARAPVPATGNSTNAITPTRDICRSRGYASRTSAALSWMRLSQPRRRGTRARPSSA